MNHPREAAAFARDEERAAFHDRTLWSVGTKRFVALRAVPEWEQLREEASRIKIETLSRLDQYLREFEKRALKNRVHVHWARTADEHNRIVADILAERGVRRVVKSKSMLTEECGLNPYLERRGVEIIDTDLGERIVQLAGQPPSHIVTPAIHMRKEDVGELFHRTLGSEEGATDPAYLTGVARSHLRPRFLEAAAAITGVNFAVAETGGVVVCTNEGNADLGAHLAPVHIACMGIEKLIPKAADLAVFLRLLARSATGQPITVYTSHFHRPAPGAELHFVLVDNGRSDRLASAEFRDALKCIRCGACLNTCPVYRRSGGYSYGFALPGPIGSVIAPFSDPVGQADLPFASSLCGACSDVCPVKIDLHGQLYAWRQELAPSVGSRTRTPSARFVGRVLARPRLYRALARLALRALPILGGRGWAAAWSESRELPVRPRESFRAWYLKNRHGL